jgi:hypothetical protein
MTWILEGKLIFQIKYKGIVKYENTKSERDQENL